MLKVDEQSLYAIIHNSLCDSPDKLDVIPVALIKSFLVGRGGCMTAWKRLWCYQHPIHQDVLSPSVTPSPKLAVNAATAADSGVNHHNANLKQKLKAYRLPLFLCMQLKVLFMVYRRINSLPFSEAAFTSPLCWQNREAQSCSQSLQKREFKHLFSLEIKVTIAMRALCMRIVGVPHQALCQIFNLDLQLLGSGYYYQHFPTFLAWTIILKIKFEIKTV